MTSSYKKKVKASVGISYQAEFTGHYKEGLEELAFFLELRESRKLS